VNKFIGALTGGLAGVIAFFLIVLACSATVGGPENGGAALAILVGMLLAGAILGGWVGRKFFSGNDKSGLPPAV
jgi:hypothetical protein